MNAPEKLSRRPRRLGLLATLATFAALIAAAISAAPAMAEFGLNNFDITFSNEDGSPATQAGSHPYAVTASFLLNNTEIGSSEWELDGALKNDVFGQIPGLIGDATAMPRCATTDFLDPNYTTLCPQDTQVGLIAVALNTPKTWSGSPVFVLPPPPGVAVRIGFPVFQERVVVDFGLKQAPVYNVVGSQTNVSQILKVFGGKLQLWGTPQSPAHDHFRAEIGSNGFPNFNCWFQGLSHFEGDVHEVDFVPAPEACSAGVKDPRPFLTLPGSCTGPALSTYEADSWQNPTAWVSGGVLSHDNAIPPNPQGFTGCGKLGFAPAVESKPTSEHAEAGTGLDFNVDFNQEGLTSPTGLAQSEAKKAEITLPEGVTINPSIGEGLGVCTPADLQRETLESAPGAGCPNSSKVGTLHLDTPIVDEGVEGSVFLAQQDDPATATPGAENPFDSLIALYLVLKNPNLGVNIKLPLKVEPDPKTGQLVTTLDDIPQLPFSHFNFHFREGQRAPLVTPSACGTYTTKSVFYPWSDPASPRTVLSDFQITKGVNGGECPSGGIPPFKPDFEAGSINNNAKAFSPFDMRLIRHDGEQDMTKFSSILPPGVLGKLAGVSKCSDAAIAAAGAKTGRQELASPSCPANSEIGHTLAGAGVGPALTYVPGKIYLGGPYKGDPLSVVSVTPAVAGPFDAGTVVVRLALTLNPETAEVEVDGANSDPIPHILKGIPLKLRDLRVHVDRNDFILNPTSCDPSSAKATLFGSYLDLFSPTDDRPVDLSTPYQAANCLNLGFKPALKINLKGGTKRGGHPALHAVLNARPNDANIGKATVTLPKSAFLDQAHIRTICTRVQFAAKACPPGAIYGHAKAITPLLDEPVEGPVYLRSSNHKLPDLVAALHGLVDVNVVGRIDSFKGGIRSSFETVPDAPVSKFILDMQGGKKGLVINSRNLCAGNNKANAQFVGQNGVPHSFHPLVKPSCGGKRKQSK